LGISVPGGGWRLGPARGRVGTAFPLESPPCLASATMGGSMRLARLTVTVLAVALLAAPLAAEAQEAGKVPRIGVLSAGAAPSLDFADILRRGLAELGWIEGQNVHIDYRYAEGRPDRYPALVSELLSLKVDVLVVGGGTPGRTGRQAGHNYDPHCTAHRGRSRRSGLGIEPRTAWGEHHRAFDAKHRDQRETG
jgi:hypothetical protein